VPVFTIATGLKDFVNALSEGRAPMNSFERAVEVEQVIAAIARSNLSRQWERVDYGQDISATARAKIVDA
jgi:predicted dehydrogenase